MNKITSDITSRTRNRLTLVPPGRSTGALLGTPVADAKQLALLTKLHPARVRTSKTDLRELFLSYFLFLPSKKIYPIPESDRNSLQDVFIHTSDREKLHGFFMPAKNKTSKVMLYLHGNDYNVYRWYLAPAHLQQRLDVNVLIADYRGYGSSTGKPTSYGIISDALAMYKFLTDNWVKPEDILVYGRSLGGAVALELTSRVLVKGVVVQSSFLSLRELFKYHMPYFPQVLVKNDVFNSEELIKKVNVPVFVSHGLEDDILLPSHSERLFQAANEPKYYASLPGAGHFHLNDFYTDEYFQILREMHRGSPIES